LSIESFDRRYALVQGPGVLLVAACFVLEARAAAVDFRPAMTFGVFHDGNISVIGAGQGDEVATLAFDLTWDRSTPTSTLALSYRPSFVTYHQSSGLDYFANTFALDFTRNSSDAAPFTVGVYLARTDYQGQSADKADSATTFVPRSTQTVASINVNSTVPAGRRGFVDWQLRGGTQLFEDSPDDPTTAAVDPVDLNDGTWVGGHIAWREELSVRSTLGLALNAGRFGYASTSTVVVATLGLVGTNQLGPSWNFDYSAGASRATSNGAASDGFYLNATIAYVAGGASTFTAGVRQTFSPGSGLGGATQDRGVWVSYTHTSIARGLTGSVFGGYWQRGALQVGSGDTATLNFRGSIGWDFNRYVALEGTYAIADQVGTNGADPALDTNYGSYGLVLRWAIRGR